MTWRMLSGSWLCTFAVSCCETLAIMAPVQGQPASLEQPRKRLDTHTEQDCAGHISDSSGHSARPLAQHEHDHHQTTASKPSCQVTIAPSSGSELADACSRPAKQLKSSNSSPVTSGVMAPSCMDRVMETLALHEASSDTMTSKGFWPEAFLDKHLSLVQRESIDTAVDNLEFGRADNGDIASLRIRGKRWLLVPETTACYDAILSKLSCQFETWTDSD